MKHLRRWLMGESKARSNEAWRAFEGPDDMDHWMMLQEALPGGLTEYDQWSAKQFEALTGAEIEGCDA